MIVILSGLFTAANKWKKYKFVVPQTQKLDNTDTINVKPLRLISAHNDEPKITVIKLKTLKFPPISLAPYILILEE